MNDMNQYMREAITTAIYPSKGDNLYYPTLGLVGEAGEVAEKVKKVMRDDDGVLTSGKRREIVAELGDILWYVAAMCYELGYDMSAVAEMNLSKLRGRQERGTLQGSGDER